MNIVQTASRRWQGVSYEVHDDGSISFLIRSGRLDLRDVGMDGIRFDPGELPFDAAVKGLQDVVGVLEVMES